LPIAISSSVVIASEIPEFGCPKISCEKSPAAYDAIKSAW
jgi:hypothetical protein